MFTSKPDKNYHWLPCFFPLSCIGHLNKVMLWVDSLERIERRELDANAMLVDDSQQIMSKDHLRNVRNRELRFKTEIEKIFFLKFKLNTTEYWTTDIQWMHSILQLTVHCHK